MKKDKLLLLDEHVQKCLKVKNSILLFNRFNSNTLWDIKIGEQKKITTQITKFSDAISDLLIDSDFLEFEASRSAKMKIVRPLVGIISYTLIDRLVRIIKLSESINLNNVSIPILNEYRSVFYHKMELYAFLRDDWQLNQFIINKLINSSNLIDFSKNSQNSHLSYQDWDFYGGFNKKYKSNNFKSLFEPVKVIKSNLFYWLYRFTSISSINNRILSDDFGYHQPYFVEEGYTDKKSGFIDFKRIFSPLSFINQTKMDLVKRQKLKNLLNSQILYNLAKILNKIGFSDNETEPYIVNFSELFFMLYPLSGFEASRKLFESAYSQVKRYKSKVYITINPSAGEYHYYINAAATQLDFKVIGVQHSAWGGYFSNAPHLAEELINGIDYYITSGWTHKESHLPTWKIKAIPLSSPAYTELRKTFKIKNNAKKNVLISLGQIYQYPVIHHGIYYIDTLKEWSNFLTELIQLLINKDIFVLIKPFCKASADVTAELIREWDRLFNDKIKIIQDYRKGKAIDYFDNVFATIWDSPTGGFVESLLTGKPAFSIASNKLMEFQPESNIYIDNLKKQGLLNEKANIMANNIELAMDNNKWWSNEKRKESINSFLNKFIITNEHWRYEWKDFFSKQLSSKID